MTWLSAWLRARVLQWLGVQQAIDAVALRSEKLSREVDSRAMAEAAYAHEQLGKQRSMHVALYAEHKAMQAALVRHWVRMDGHTEQLVDLQTAPKVEAPREISSGRGGGWGAVVARIEESEARQRVG